MALRSKNKIDSSFSMASMSDMVFLLLIFFMVTSTLVAPNALKLLLPSSNSQTEANAVTTVSIKDNNDGTYSYAVETIILENITDIEYMLRDRLAGKEDPYVSLHVDKSVPMEEVVKVMNIAKDNNYKLILATSPIRKN